MRKAKPQIGLVLAKTPGYSETFFNSKIHGLMEKGYTVKVFINKKVYTPYPKNWIVQSQPQIQGPLILLIPRILLKILGGFILKPKNMVRFWRLEKKDQVRGIKRILHLYSNSHILMHNLAWLHFGFSTMTLGKENVAKAIGAKMVISLRGYDISVYPLKHSGCYDRLWEKVDKVHTLSDDLIQIARNFGMPSFVKWQKIPPAICLTRFQNDGKGYARLYPTIKILSVARLHWKKGLDYALQAIQILKEHGYSIHYTIIGEGEDWEKLNYARYQMGLEKEISFTGKISHTKIPAYMHEHSIYLQPSVQEGFCNSVLEAQAAGMLCIVTNAEGLTENIVDEKSGWIVPRRDPEAIAEKIMALRSTPVEELTQIRAAAIKRVADAFSLTHQIEKFIAFYQTPAQQHG